MIRLFLDKNTPMVLDTIRNGIVCEPLARSDDYLQGQGRHKNDGEAMGTNSTQ